MINFVVGFLTGALVALVGYLLGRRHQRLETEANERNKA